MAKAHFIQSKKFKPTLKKPTPQGKRFEKKFKATMGAHDVNLTEVDLPLNEKEQSLKKQIWDLAKMEALVHGDPKLSGVYNEMSEDGEEKYGYHYNETIMNIIFNEYVLNSAEYLQKYKNSIPVEKKRRDKSGINQLQQKGEEKQDKKEKSDKKNEDVKKHNNSLVGVIEEEPIDNNGIQRHGQGDFDDREYLTHRIEKKHDIMSNVQEHHLSSREDKIDFILSRKGDTYSMERLQGAPDEQIDDIYSSIEKEMLGVDETTGAASSGAFSPALGYEKRKIGEALDFIKEMDGLNESKEEQEEKREDGEEVDETTTSASSGQYSTPHAFAKKGSKQRHSQKPAWDGGEIIKEGDYLSDGDVFKQIFESIEESKLRKPELKTPQLKEDDLDEGMNSPNDDSRVPMAEKSVSKAQQRFMGQVYAYKKGELEDASDAVKKAADSMSMEDAEDFASTKHKGLPEKVDEDVTDHYKNYIDQLLQQRGVGMDQLSDQEKMELLLKASDMTQDRLAGMVSDPSGINENPLVGAVVRGAGAAIAGKVMGEAGYSRHDLDVLTASARKRIPMSKLLDWASATVLFSSEDPTDAINSFMKENGVNLETFANLVDIYLDDLGYDESTGVQTGEQDVLVDLKDAIELDYTPSDVVEGVEEAIVYEDQDFAEEIVQYDSERSGEVPFDINGQKWQYVNAIYPDGKKDIGVYRFGHDLVYSYDWFKKNILGESMNEDEIQGTTPLTMLARILGNTVFKHLRDSHEDLIKVAQNTADLFFGGDYTKAIAAAQKFLPRTNEGMIQHNPETMAMSSDNQTTMAKTMKDVSGGMSMGEGAINERPQIDGKNELADFGTSNSGHGGFNGKGDGNHPHYKEPTQFGAPTMDSISEADDKHGVCENCGSQLDEDGYCRADEEPVAGKVKGEKGACKKKKTYHRDSFEKAGENKHNVEKRKERERDYKKKVDKKDNDMKKEKISEDKKPSALVQLDRLKKDNEKNFKSDMKDSNSADIAKDQKELRADDQYTEVDDPQKLSQDIEKDKIKQNKGESFENVGNSTNDNNKEIPKRNHTNEESDQVSLDRGKGMHDIVYDNEPDERFEERMKKDMGEEIYKLRQDKMDYRKDAPMYNKDTQPVDDKTIDKVQYEKEKAGWNQKKGFHNESTLTGKYKDEFGNTKFVDFKLNETNEVEAVESEWYKLNLHGLGNIYTQKVQENTDMRDFMNSFDFYFNGKNVVKTKSSVGVINESTEEKPIVNEGLEKMKKLWGYDPSKHVGTSSVKKNRGF